MVEDEGLSAIYGQLFSKYISNDYDFMFSNFISFIYVPPYLMHWVKVWVCIRGCYVVEILLETYGSISNR